MVLLKSLSLFKLWAWSEPVSYPYFRLYYLLFRTELFLFSNTDYTVQLHTKNIFEFLDWVEFPFNTEAVRKTLEMEYLIKAHVHLCPWMEIFRTWQIKALLQILWGLVYRCCMHKRAAVPLSIQIWDFLKKLHMRMCWHPHKLNIMCWHPQFDVIDIVGHRTIMTEYQWIWLYSNMECKKRVYGIVNVSD